MFDVAQHLTHNGSSKSCAKRLSLTIKRRRNMINGVSISSHMFTEGVTQAELIARSGESTGLFIELIVVSDITVHLPTQYITGMDSATVVTEPLADPAFDKPGPIDVSLGAGVYASIIEADVKRLPNGLTAQASTIGWLLFGNIRSEDAQMVHHYIGISTSNDNLELCLRKLWEQDECFEQHELSAEERLCEEAFERTAYRDADGRYVIEMPINPKNNVLGETRDIAWKRYVALARHFKRDPEFYLKYAEFINQAISEGHILLADRPVLIGGQSNYLPHHAVTKNFGSSSTALVNRQTDCL